jgi:hypothetical protein
MKATSVKVCVGRMSVLMADIPRVMAVPYTDNVLHVPQAKLASHSALVKLSNEVNSRKPWIKPVVTHRSKKA